MVKQTKSFRLMGTTITVTETYEGEFESQRIFIEENKHLFKYRGIIEKLKMFPSNVVIMNAIRHAGGTSLVFMMEKKLEESDIKKDQNRFYILKSELLLRYLTRDEKQRIEQQGKDGGLDVLVIDPRAKTYTLKMKIWQSSGSSNKYVLIKEWAKLVRENGLQKGDLVEIWFFRVDSKLRIAVNAEKIQGSTT